MGDVATIPLFLNREGAKDAKVVFLIFPNVMGDVGAFAALFDNIMRDVVTF
jgi:hypothetical protein